MVFSIWAAHLPLHKHCHPVYVAMNGRYFNALNVRKNKQTGMFEEIN
jgi:L-asparaginase